MSYSKLKTKGRKEHMSDVVLMIPARLASSRLPNKPLADIAGKPMIVHVYERAVDASLGDVVVACSEQEVADAILQAGGKAVMTDPDLPSGTDRIYAALEALNQHYKYVINIQGDLPTLDPQLIIECYEVLKQKHTDISTLITPITNKEELTNPNVVKAVVAFDDDTSGKALYFSRATVPYGEGTCYHHIGMYGYTYDALKKFVSLPPSALEKREKLEQLRALENGLSIAAKVVDTIPLGVDTQEDLEKARNHFKA